MEQNSELKVNDGGGLYDSAGFVDTIIMDCNGAVKQLVSGNYIAFCNGMAETVKKLALLKDGVKNEKEDLERQISELREMLERSGEDAAGSVYNPLDGGMGGREESLRDVIAAENN